MISTRHELGSRMLEWHGGQDDPVYAVGSFYIDGTVYPHPRVVWDAIFNLNRELTKFRRMNRGVKVSASTAYGTTDDLKRFAGYTRRTIRENIADLRSIVEALERYRDEDYNYKENKTNER